MLGCQISECQSQ
uniref:Uncharacterized protein n=1 Tax=Anguilla anguilla TaxID=7936 RepID=A0A0E9VFR3_ANGAN